MRRHSHRRTCLSSSLMSLQSTGDNGSTLSTTTVTVAGFEPSSDTFPESVLSFPEIRVLVSRYSFSQS